jgi:2-polyprenyl-3-methyl-5-hydroxy-6-metoxy-1,4-benzoquinol methylase
MNEIEESLFVGKQTSSEVKQVYKNSLGKEYGNIVLGNNTSRIFREDPKLLLFTLSRYKFVSKLLQGKKSVLEVGCQEGFGAQIVAKNVGNYVGIDFFQPYISDANKFSKYDNIEFEGFDLLDGPFLNKKSDDFKFDGVFSLDVIEHIDAKNDNLFMKNCIDSLNDEGILIVGTPSLESQLYASEASKAGHINCKSAPELKELFERFFKFVFIFSLNDEVVHTGFWQMSHYIVAVGCGKR